MKLAPIIMHEIEGRPAPRAKVHYTNPLQKRIARGATAERALVDVLEEFARLGVDDAEHYCSTCRAYLAIAEGK